MGTLVLFLISEKKLSTFHHSVCYVSCGLVIDGLYYVEVQSYTYFVDSFYHERCWILSNTFPVLLK